MMPMSMPSSRGGAGVSKGCGVIGRLTPSLQAKLRSKLARRAQLVVVLHVSGEQHVDIDHKFNVSTLLEGMEGA